MNSNKNRYLTSIICTIVYTFLIILSFMIQPIVAQEVVHEIDVEKFLATQCPEFGRPGYWSFSVPELPVPLGQVFSITGRVSAPSKLVLDETMAIYSESRGLSFNIGIDLYELKREKPNIIEDFKKKCGFTCTARITGFFAVRRLIPIWGEGRSTAFGSCGIGMFGLPNEQKYYVSAKIIEYVGPNGASLGEILDALKSLPLPSFK